MIEVELDGTTWYVTTREYHSDSMARVAWERLNVPLKGRGLNLGIYRHGSPKTGPVMVTAVSYRRESVKTAELHLLPGGMEVYLDRDEALAFIWRRIRVVVEQERPGYLSIRRGLAGARLNPDGTMDERIGRG